MANAHSILAPSAAGIWGKLDGCTGWAAMSQMYPDSENSEAALEGEAGHEIAEDLVKQFRQGQILKPVDHYVGKKASNGVVYDEDMYSGALIYALDISNVMRESGVFSDKFTGIEDRLTMEDIHPELFGTCDFWLFDGHRRKLYVYDFKYGYGVVEPYENWQAMCYVKGVLNKLNLNGLESQDITVHIRIGQPRTFHREGQVREWVVPLTELRGYFNILTQHAAQALSENAITCSGSHCRYCTARHSCEAALTAGMNLYEVATTPTPLDLSPMALGVQLNILKRAKEQLDYLYSGMEEQIRTLQSTGIDVPYWTLEAGVGREKWTKPADEIIALGKLLKTDLEKEPEAITPAKARKLGIDDAVISAYSTKPSTGLKLVPDNGNKAKQVFK